MTLDQVFELLKRARDLSRHREMVIVGSNAVLGKEGTTWIPADMTLSLNCGTYLKADPGRTGDLVKALGEGSPFHREFGFYLDPVSPNLPTLPEQWEARLIPIERDNVCAWFLDPDDTAVSKYARGEDRDIRWIRAGLSASILSIDRIKRLFPKTMFLDAAEERAAQSRLEADEAWLRGK